MLFAKFLSLAPLPLLYLVSDGLYFLGYYMVGYRRRLVRENLAAAFPEKTPDERKRIEKDFYRRLCDYAIETLKLLTISKESLRKRMVFTNPGLIEDCHARGQSLLYLTSHQFNWEWLLAAGSFALPFPVKFVYQKMSATFAEELSMQCRTRFGAVGLERGEVAIEALRHRNELQGIAIVGDQYPGHGQDKKFPAVFLNRETVFFAAINQLAILTQYEVVYFEIERKRRGYYAATARIIGRPPYARDSEDVIQAYIKSTEDTIRKFPSGWLWSHNRWKTRHLKQA